MNKLSQETVDALLRHGKVYEVGGTVRDRYLSETPVSKDTDYLVTGIPFDELTKILKRFGRVDLVGQSFGVIKFTDYRDGESRTFDITLPRREHSTGTGHKEFDVAFDPELAVEDDLLRRDFTINTMAIELATDRLIDPFGGKHDIDNKRLRIVYPESFKDDPLRMLRAIQFAARFEFTIESETMSALRENGSLITTVSAERIAEELNKLLQLSRRPSVGFRLMSESGLLEHVLPELELCKGVEQPGGFHRHDVFDHIMEILDACRPDLRLRLAALFHDITKPQAKRLVEGGATFYGHEITGARTAREVLTRLRYSVELIEQVALLVERHMFTTEVTDKGLRRFIRKVSIELTPDLLDLRRADVIAQGMGGTTEDVDQLERRIEEELSRKPPFALSDLTLDGNDLMRLFGIERGPLVGEILDHLMECVLDDPKSNSLETLTGLAKDFYKRKINKET